MTKWKVIRIREHNFNRAIEGAKYGESIDSIFEKLLDIRDATMLQQNTEGKKDDKT
jgi:hypothetical protein